MVHKTRLAVSFFIVSAVSLLLIAVLFFIVKDNRQTVSPAEQIAMPGQPFTVENFRYTVTNVHESSTVVQGIDIFASTTTAREGAKFVVFDISAENIGKERGYVNKGSMFVTDSEDRKFDVAGGKDKVFRESPAIDPGLTAEFIDFYVEVPQDAQGLVLHITSAGLFSSEEARSSLEPAGAQNSTASPASAGS